MEFRVRRTDDTTGRWTVANSNKCVTTTFYVLKDGTEQSKTCEVFDTEAEAQAALDLYLEKQKLARFGAAYNAPADVIKTAQDRLGSGGKLISVNHKDYMSLSDAHDKHSRNLMNLKGEEYAIDGDFLAMENRLAGMLGDSPEYVSLVMAGKHITAIGIILEKNKPEDIKLEKLDERIRDACNLLKITAAFIHAKQNDFSLHLGKDEKQESTPGYGGKIDRTKPTPGGF